MDQPPQKRLTPVVSRVCGETIVELVYDAKARSTALAIGADDQWSIATKFETAEGETLIPYAADNTLIRHECVLLPSQPASAGTKDELLQDIRAYLRHYLDLSPLFERLAAHYVLLTWVFDAFNELPYLRFQGDFGSGKTRGLIVLGSIVYKGFFASGASTVSPIFHTLDAFGGTLILDEADLRHSGKTADLVKILNNGTVKGLPVLRTMQNRYKEFNPAAFTVFGPKIIAMRGNFRDEALESRFLTEAMGGRPLREDVPIQLPNALKEEAAALRNRLLDFRLKNLFAVKSNAARVVAGIDPRLNQTALSLASLVDDPELLRSFETMLRARQSDLDTLRSRNLARRTMAALEEAFDESPRAYVPLREIADRINASGEDAGHAASPREVGRILRENAVPLRKTRGNIVVAKEAPPG